MSDLVKMTLGAAAVAGACALVVPHLGTQLMRPGTAPATAAVPPAPEAARGNAVVLRADGQGHYEAEIHIEGTPVRALVDTGASLVALPAEVAARAGVRAWPDARRLRLSTANGIVEAPVVRLREVRLGNIVLRDVEAAICPPGTLSTPLLGMTFLGRLTGFEARSGELHLRG